ncbi:hypothetical protein [Amycolatopsis sp. NPDC021455]|uniref:hypothetical protein n=1 Tax=Amycolatopsis sp. NPDC021455 TaxID=3154901 RepID=UPI003410901C
MAQGNPAEFVRAQLALGGVQAQVSARTVAYQRLSHHPDWSVSVYCAAEAKDPAVRLLRALGLHRYHDEPINETQVWIQMLLSAEAWHAIQP